MKTLLEQSEGLDDLIHKLNKVIGKMFNGHFFDAHREISRVVADLQKAKHKLIASVDTERLREAVIENDEQKELAYLRGEIRRLEGLLKEKNHDK
jgi:hypothetical protein